MSRDQTDPKPQIFTDKDGLAATNIDSLAPFFANDRERAGTETYIGDTQRLSLTSSATIELLAFWVATEEYAVEITHIQEIIKVPVVTHVPRVKPIVLGLISLRGTIVPIVDLRRLLRLETDASLRLQRILVLRVDNQPLGLVVDRVTSVVRLERDSIEPKPRGMRRETSDYVEGVGRVQERMLIVLNVPALLSSMDSLA